jgi:hypothetical protein
LGIERQPRIKRHNPGIERQQSGDQAHNFKDQAPSNLPDLKDLLTANDGSMIFFVQYCGLSDCCGRRNLSLELFYTTWDQDFYALIYLVKYLSLSLSIYEKLTRKDKSSVVLSFLTVLT